MRLIPVQPSSQRTVAAFIRKITDCEGGCELCDGRGCGGVDSIEVSDYPESVEGLELRECRRELGLSLGEASSKLGIGVVELSNLERGALTVDPAYGWPLLRLALTR